MRRPRLALVCAMVLGAVPALAQSRAVPRTPDGKPDLTGVWQAGNTQRGTWQEANGGSGLGGSGLNENAPRVQSSSDRPAGAEPAPYQPWAAQKVLEAFNRRGIDDPTGLCLPPGVPRVSMLGLYPQQFIQTPNAMVILYEYANSHRLIRLNAAHPDDVLPGYMGDSVGRWEGDTLVVDVTGFNDRTWIAGAGTFHTEALHVVERYTRVDADQINYEARVEDPNVLTRPWVLRTTMMRREGTRIEENICVENNIDVDRYEKLLKEGVDFTRH
ncbi:MAG: hypothetical protein HY824_15760 [Acidobacteria bacterium]|nr:hypothetical protein [Acidobacteriota bacterium]